MNTADMVARVLADADQHRIYRIPNRDRDGAALPDSYMHDNNRIAAGERAYYLAALVEARQNGWLEDGDQYLAGGRRQRVTPAGRLRMAATSTLVGVA